MFSPAINPQGYFADGYFPPPGWFDVETSNPLLEFDGYWQIGRRIIWKPRPKTAEPARAEAAVVKRIAKKLTAVAKDDRPKAASLYVNRAMRLLAGFIESKRAHSVAHGNADRLTNEEIALIKAYWKSVEATALALMEEEDDDDLLLLA